MNLSSKIPWILMGVVLVNFMLIAGFKLVVIKASDRVIQKLQKEYSPSPFGPGFDPDKVDTQALGSEKIYYQLQQTDSQENMYSLVKQADDWRTEWERQRGFINSTQ